VKLQTLAELNAERAARRPVIVVTRYCQWRTAAGQGQGLRRRSLRAELSKQLRMERAAWSRPAARSCFSRLCADRKARDCRAVHISQALARCAFAGL